MVAFVLVSSGHPCLPGVRRTARVSACRTDCSPEVGGECFGTGMEGAAAGTAAGGVHGFPAVLASFVGRDGAVREVAGLPEEYRLVAVTGALLFPRGVTERVCGRLSFRSAG
jgi:hypothetical protein